MPILLTKRPNAHLLLVGGGPMEEALKAQAALSAAADRIHFVGRVPHDEVERYYALIDILAYPRKAMRLTELVTPLKPLRSEEHTSELQSLMRISYAVFCLKKKTTIEDHIQPAARNTTSTNITDS